MILSPGYPDWTSLYLSQIEDEPKQHVWILKVVFGHPGTQVGSAQNAMTESKNKFRQSLVSHPSATTEARPEKIIFYLRPQQTFFYAIHTQDTK
jgi:hypothetical protein